VQVKSNFEYLEKHDKLKKCAFPGCSVRFFGRGKTKYCEEHKKNKHYFELYHKNRIKKIDINQIIRHEELYCKTIMLKCSIENCFSHFNITLIPGVYVYPKYCPDHRSEHKRELFLKKD
jgi:hypothetical protein